MLLDLKLLRRSLDLTQAEMAKKLGITRNYLALMETGRRNVPTHVQSLAETLLRGAPAPIDSRAVVHDPPSKYECRIPADCDLPARLDQMQAELHDLKGKMDTLLGLLGGPLRSAVGLERDDKDRAG